MKKIKMNLEIPIPKLPQMEWWQLLIIVIVLIGLSKGDISFQDVVEVFKPKINTPP